MLGKERSLGTIFAFDKSLHQSLPPLRWGSSKLPKLSAFPHTLDPNRPDTNDRYWGVCYILLRRRRVQFPSNRYLQGCRDRLNGRPPTMYCLICAHAAKRLMPLDAPFSQYRKPGQTLNDGCFFAI